MLDYLSKLIGENMSAKALQQNLTGLKESDLYAFKTEKARRTYPFDEISPDLVLKINPRAKRLALRVDPRHHKVNLVIPKRASMRSAYHFALENKYWIREKLADLPRPKPLVDGETIQIFGQKIKINVTYDKTLKITTIYLTENELVVHTNKEDPSQRITRFLKNMVREAITELAHEKAAKIDKTIQKIEIKDTISRWGSCSHDGKLSFSWRLIFATQEAFDYVIAHEVAHLAVMDHSPAFWEVCEKLSKNYSKGKNWMKRHGGELVRYT
jgi:hypothetical protein